MLNLDPTGTGILVEKVGETALLSCHKDTSPGEEGKGQRTHRTKGEKPALLEVKR